MSDQLLVVLITAPSMHVAEQLGRALVENKLAACVNILPGMRSIYVWKGAIQTDEEVLLLVKTSAALFSDGLVPAVKALHPYELPEIIALPIQMGAPDYLEWVQQEMRQV